MIQEVFSDQTTNFVLFLLVLLPAVQWITGVARAVANNTFTLQLVDVFVRTDIAGRVVPLGILIITGRIIAVGAPDALEIPGLDLSVLTTGGIAAAVVYLVVVVKNIIDNVNPSQPDAKPEE